MKHLILFDFDGTISTKDSLPHFIQYAVGRSSYYLKLLLLIPMLTAYALGRIPNHLAKEKLLAHFFKGWDQGCFQKIADRYALEKLNQIIKPKALEKLIWHQTQNHHIVIVSASMECWLKKWCQKYNIDLIATRLEVQNGKLTGKFATKNCYGMEKVKRIKERYNLSEYNVIYAYGDSVGDQEMLSIAHKRYYQHFDSR